MTYRSESLLVQLPWRPLCLIFFPPQSLAHRRAHTHPPSTHFLVFTYLRRPTAMFVLLLKQQLYVADATAQLFMLSQFKQLHFQALLNYLSSSCICVSLLCICFSLFCLYSSTAYLFFLMLLGCGVVCCCGYCVMVFGKTCAYSGGPVGLNFVSSHQLWTCALWF